MRSTIDKYLATLFVAVLLLTPSAAMAVATPVRLAIIPAAEPLHPACDLLTAELSKSTQFALMERAQIDKVFREQGASASSAENIVKLGHILGTDGLLVLEVSNQDGQQLLNLRLVAVKPGVVLLQRQFPWPLKEQAEWPAQVLRLIAPFAPKLQTLTKDALPISVLNLRSSIRRPGVADEEWTLTQILIHRLANEPEVFILERQNMSSLVFEKQQEVEDNSPFWTGRYVLDGTLDKDGFSPDKITIHARLVSPRQTDPVLIQVDGPRNQPSVLIEKLVTQVMSALHAKATGADWNSHAEALQYAEEAKWAFRWQLLRQAQEASESAWALGARMPDLSVLRIRSYMEDGLHGNSRSPVGYPEATLDLRALELYAQDAPAAFATNATDQEFLKLGIELLTRSTDMMEKFYHSVPARRGCEEHLAEIRSTAQRVSSILEDQLCVKTNYLPKSDRQLGYALSGQKSKLQELQWENGGVWFETPEQGVVMLRRTLELGFGPRITPMLAGWGWEHRRRITRVRNQFYDDLRHDSNPRMRWEGFLLEMIQSPTDEEGTFARREEELMTELFSQRAEIFAGGGDILWRIEHFLEKRYGDGDGGWAFRKKDENEPYKKLLFKLRKEYLATGTTMRSDAYHALFDSGQGFTEAQGREVMPLITEFAKRVKVSPEWLAERHIEHPAAAPPHHEPVELKAVAAAPRKQGVFAAQFVEWNLAAHGIASDYLPEFYGVTASHGDAWVQIRYRRPGEYGIKQPVYFVGIHGTSNTVVQFPSGLIPITSYCQTSRFGGGLQAAMMTSMDATEDSLVVSVQNQIERYRFREKTWESIPVPIENGAAIAEYRGKIYLATQDSVMELNLETKEVRILASCRRRPALNALDSLNTLDSGIFRCETGRIGLTAEHRSFLFEPETSRWTEVPKAPEDRQEVHGFISKVTFGLNGRGNGSVIASGTFASGGLRVPVQFEKNGQPGNPDDPHPGEIALSRQQYQFTSWIVPDKPAWCSTGAGIVVVNRAMDGHWYIPKSEYEAKIAALRKSSE